MKKIFLLVIPFLLSCNNRNIKNDLSNLKLYGKVKKITENVYKAVEKFGEIQKGDKDKTIMTIFNKDGNTTEYSQLSNPYSPLDTKYEYVYNNESKMSEYTSYKYLISIIDFNNIKYIMDSKVKYLYDANGNKTELNKYNKDGNLQLKVLIICDKNGNIIQEKCINALGKTLSISKYKFDNNNNLIETNELGEDTINSFFKTTYKYDENGNQIEIQYWDNKSIKLNKEVYAYDDKSNIIEIKYLNNDGTLNSTIGPAIKTYKYEFDDTKNWTKKITYEDNKPSEISEREIEYY